MSAVVGVVGPVADNATEHRETPHPRSAETLEDRAEVRDRESVGGELVIDDPLDRLPRLPEGKGQDRLGNRRRLVCEDAGAGYLVEMPAAYHTRQGGSCVASERDQDLRPGSAYARESVEIHEAVEDLGANTAVSSWSQVPVSTR